MIHYLCFTDTFSVGSISSSPDMLLNNHSQHDHRHSDGAIKYSTSNHEAIVEIVKKMFFVIINIMFYMLQHVEHVQVMTRTWGITYAPVIISQRGTPKV